MPKPGRLAGHFLTRQQTFRKPIQRTGGPRADNTGAPLFGRRKNFDEIHRFSRMHKRLGMNPFSREMANVEDRWRHLGGTCAEKPEEEWIDPRNERFDECEAKWRKRGRLQMHSLLRAEIYVCYKCGYPMKSKLVAVLDDNWDYRMCHGCYEEVVADGLENHTG